jgi:hypothetical protein
LVLHPSSQTVITITVKQLLEIVVIDKPIAVGKHAPPMVFDPVGGTRNPVLGASGYLVACVALEPDCQLQFHMPGRAGGLHTIKIVRW